MAGTQLRLVGTTATGAPVIKRGVATFSDGRTVSMFIDSNFVNAGGTDITGVTKILLYVSNDTSRTTFTLAANYTPPVSPASATRFARASMTVASDNSVWVAWQGIDNGLYVTRWSYAAGVLTFVATETVQAAGATTDRFRAVDIDLTGTATAAVIAYEANASTGNASFHKVYIRSNAATWVRAVNLTALSSGQFIRDGSEDVCIAWRGDGIVSNVGRFLIYGTKTHTTADLGDILREYSFNVSTAVADSGAILGTWSSAYNKDQAAGTRRAMLFTLSSTIYLFSGVIGAGVPKFIASKLTTGNYTAPVVSTAGYVSTISLSNFFKIDPASNNRTYVSMSYKDNRLLFGFAGVGTSAAPRIFREVSMSWANVSSVTAKPTIDAIPRPMDSAYYGETSDIVGAGPIGLYGGDNRRTQASLKYYNFLAFYGRGGNQVNSTAWTRKLRFVAEDTFDAPALISPYAVEPTSRPVYRVRVENVNLQPNLYGKIHAQVASDIAFTTSVKDIIEDDSKLQYFGSQDGLTGTIKQVAVPTITALTSLTQGTWYWRARIVSDKDTPGAWTGAQVFTVSHAPVALPIAPTPASTVPDIASNNYNFSWTRSDTDPNDTQTAYRVIVRRRDTFANVVDTGFISSSATTVTINIDANGLGILEIPLDWQVQLKDADGVTGPFSSLVQFTIGDPPLIDIVNPDGITPVTTALPEIDWTFSGFGGRVQRAYRVTIFDNTTPNLLLNPSFETTIATDWAQADGTAVQSSAQVRRGTFSAFITPNGTGPTPRVEAVPANRPVVSPGDQLTIEGYLRPTTVNKPIVLGINWYDGGGVYISTSSITAPALAATWQYLKATFTAPAGAARAAAHAGVGGTPAVGDTVYVDQINMHLPSPTTDNSIITTNWRVGTETAYTFPTQALVDAHNYGVTVEVQDSGGLTTEATEFFTTDWIEPALASGVTVTTPDAFKVRVAWTNAAQDSDFVAYRVYRRYMKTAIPALDVEDTANNWYLMYETSELLTNYTFDDYLAPLNTQVEYAVVQLADRFGSLIESNLVSGSFITLAADRYYFVPMVLIGGIASFEANNVTGDTFSRDVEQETIHVKGRGRQVQIGDDLGYSGTLVIKNRNPTTARRDRQFFELVSAEYNSVYVKNPFGDVVLVALGVVSSTRQAGYGGSADIVDISLPYTEIIDEALTIRQPS